MANTSNRGSAAVKGEATNGPKRFLRLRPAIEMIAAGAIGLSIVSTCKSADAESPAVQVSTAQTTAQEESQPIPSVEISTLSVPAVEVSTPNAKSDAKSAESSVQPITLSTASLPETGGSTAVEHAVAKSTAAKAEKPQRCEARTIDESTPIGELVACLDNADPSGRGMAIDTLADMPDERITKAIRKRIEELTKDSDFNVRESAVGALGKIGMISSLPAIQAAVNDENGWVRDAAFDSIAFFIGRGEDTSIILTLKPLLKGESRKERIMAIVTLCLINGPYANKLFQAAIRKEERSPERNTIPFEVGTLRSRIEERAKPIGQDELSRRFKEALADEKDPEMREMLKFFTKDF
jgi:hypothetical protein